MLGLPCKTCGEDNEARLLALPGPRFDQRHMPWARLRHASAQVVSSIAKS
jgi:hypothetical protein